jgi:hypothetical protein
MAKETELVIYCRIGNEAGLAQASETILQEQAQVSGPNGKIRVRMSRSINEPAYSYELTTKHFHARNDVGVKACTETNKECDQQTYEMFKSVCDQFMRKIRYIFKIESVKIQAPGLTGELEVPDLKYEVDRFIGADGALSEWVKIDLELDALYQALENAGVKMDVAPEIVSRVTSLPFQPQSAFVDDGSKDTKLRELVSAVYSKQFVRPVPPVA